MKALFLVFHGFSAHNGISKKISYQVEALRHCGVATELCWLDIEKDCHMRKIDDHVIENFGSGIKAKINKRICYDSVTDYVINNRIELLYIRSAHNSNPFITRMVKKLHLSGVKIVMEIPTYPYEGQFKGATLKNHLRLYLDILCRKSMAKYIDKIITFANVPLIFGVPTISISNGIDFNEIPLKKEIPSQTLNLLAVAELHFWHGYDRVIEGMRSYCATDIKLHIVGANNTPEGIKLKALAEKYNLTDRVIFHGALSGEALNKAFDNADFGIASLGRHRSGITQIKTLKNREYAARGLNFVYSEEDEDFDLMPYVMRAPADESPLDIAALVAFHNSQTMKPMEIRDSIKNLSWEVQMQKVIDNV